MAGEKIAKLLHDVSNKATQSNKVTDLVYGEVISTSPLQIKVDSRYIITEDFLLLSGLCIQKTMDDTPSGIVLWRGLQTGDTVRMLRVQNGQLFYVLDREGGLTRA